MSQKKDMQRLTVDVPQGLYDKFAEIVQQHDFTISQVIRSFMAYYVRGNIRIHKKFENNVPNEEK